MKPGLGSGAAPVWASPPTRGAWIETFLMTLPAGGNPVAPHAGGVD